MLSSGVRRNNRFFVKTPEERLQKEREQMVERQLIARGITDPHVLAAFLKVPRHKFVPQALEGQAYEDHPIQIGHEQTISQPYIVALMLEQLELKKEDKVLEVGTGSGYQTALLAELVKEVDSVEIIEDLCQSAQKRLNFLGYSNVNLSCSDGRQGWAEKSPFDKIVVSAAAGEIPERLIEQLREKGLITIPVGVQIQELIVGQKINGKLITRRSVPVRFVPLTSKS